MNQILDQHHFDRNVEGLCRRYYQGRMGRPSITPGVYFRSLLLGYFEGIEEGLVEGKTVSIDATMLEGNAALRSLVRRENGQRYDEYRKDLAKAAGIENPTREQLARLDRKRKKKGSNKEWKNPYDPDARIAKMKDGSTHLAHKAEHAVDLSSGVLLAVTLQGADQGDSATIHQTLAEAGEAVAELMEHEAVMAPGEEPQVHSGGIEEVVADKGYHSGAVLQALQESACRSYILEPDRGNGKGKRRSRSRYTPTGGGPRVTAASDCSESEAS